MPVEMPEDLLKRSDGYGERANAYSRRTDQELAASNARHGTTDLGWDRNDKFDAWFTTPSNVMTFAGGIIVGLLFILMGIWNQSGLSFMFGIFLIVLGAVFLSFASKARERQHAVSQQLLTYNINLAGSREIATNYIRTRFPDSEIAHAAIQANTSLQEMNLALQAEVARAWVQINDRTIADGTARDIRQNQQELDRLDKGILLERAKGQIIVEQENAKAEADRERLKILEAQETKREQTRIEEARRVFYRDMVRLEKEQGHDAAMKRLAAVDKLRSVLIASQTELRNNPALGDRMKVVINDVTTLYNSLQALQNSTTLDDNLIESIDEALTEMVYRNLNAPTPTPNA